MNLSRSLLAAAFVVSVCLLSGCMTSRVVLPEGMQLDFNSAAEPVNETVPKVLSSAVDSPVSRIPLSAFRSFLPLTKAATAVAAAPSGNKLYLGTDDGDIFELVWDRPSNRLSKRRILESNRPILALSLSPDGSRLAFSQYSFVGILDLIQSELSAELTLVDGRILSLAWDQTADFLALGRANGDAFVWNARDNSSRELEKYSGATSPIIGLEFHPKARALFVMERGGGLYLWRVLRTEYQLGLRDTTAEIDRALQGRMVVTIGYLPGQASALWLSPDGEELLALSQAGMVYSWAVRGLVRGQTIEVGPLNAMGVHGSRVAALKNLPLMFVAGRGQQVQVWCRAVEPRFLSVDAAVPVIEPGEDLGPKAPVETDFTEYYDDDPEEAEETKKESAIPPALLARSNVFTSTITSLFERGGLSWFFLGDGSMLLAESDDLFQAVDRGRVANCIDLNQRERRFTPISRGN